MSFTGAEANHSNKNTDKLERATLCVSPSSLLTEFSLGLTAVYLVILVSQKRPDRSQRDEVL